MSLHRAPDGYKKQGVHQRWNTKNGNMGSVEEEKSIVLFDGFCNFCSGSVLFIIRRDPAVHFRFAASQSPAGSELLRSHGIAEPVPHSIILVSNGKIYRKSNAALRIARRMKGLWPLVYGLIVLPRPVRDVFYDLIARNRYRLFGRKDQCFVPDRSVRERFLGPF